MCRIGRNSGLGGLVIADLHHSLSVYTFRDLGQFYTKLESGTNFLSPYASHDYLEDFAVSMTAYYIGTRFGLQTSIEIRNPSDGQLYKTYSEFDVIKNSNLHQSKICPMSEFLFRESCSTTLGGI